MDFLLRDLMLLGAGFVSDQGVLVDDGWIAAVGPRDLAPAGARVEHLPGLLAPGYVEIQINGCGGVIFT